MDVLNHPVLVLNRSFLPVQVTTARRALVMLYGGVGRALDGTWEPHDFDAWALRKPGPEDHFVSTVRGPVCLPRILWLGGYDRIPRRSARLSRRDIFFRDQYTCQYCARRLPAAELNLDHVLPRSRGGPSAWENLVTSCRSCNLAKGNSTPEECGMPLQRRPRRPHWSMSLQAIAASRTFAEWMPFLAGFAQTSG